MSACLQSEADGPTPQKELACAAASDDTSPSLVKSASRVEHLVLIVQENHSFDSYFGRYCAGPSHAACTHGRSCCEAAPHHVGECDADARVLDDAENGRASPPHDAAEWLAQMHWDGRVFRMDRYACDAVVYADAPDDSYRDARYPEVAEPDERYPLRTYHNLAANGALADRYFQPILGASSSNVLFFARAAFVFEDNQAEPKVSSASGREYADPTLGDLLDERGVSFRVYAEGYAAWCAGDDAHYPYGYDASDNPFSYYATTRDRSVDYVQLGRDIDAARLPAVSLVRALGTRSEHPGHGILLSDGARFVKEILDRINASRYAERTLILVTWDEGGGYYDHVPPPLELADGAPLPRTVLAPHELGDRSMAIEIEDGRERTEHRPRSERDPEYFGSSPTDDGRQSYGTRVPLLALGPFAKRDYVSHRVMEHSSIVKFIEWNWLDDARLDTRDVHVNGIGDLLDPSTTGTPVPE